MFNVQDIQKVEEAVNEVAYFGEEFAQSWGRIKPFLEGVQNQTTNSRVMPCLMYAGVNEQCDVFGDGRCGSVACKLARA